MGASLLEIGKSGIFAYQQALSVVGHNIENAYTPGFNRQITQFKEQINGVSVSGIKRVYDDFLVKQLRNQISNYNSSATYFEKINDLDRFLGNEFSNIEKGMQTFFSSLANLSASPSSVSSREVFLNKSKELIISFKDAQEKLTQQNDILNSSLTSMVDKVNSLTSNIAELNRKIISSGDDGSILNERENLLNELAEYMAFNTVQHDNGQIDVFIASGDALVLSGITNSLSASPSAQSLDKIELYLQYPGGKRAVSSHIEGGKIAGLIDYRNEILDMSQQKIQQLAIVFADEFNRVHNQGMNSLNELAGNYFTNINATNLVENRVVSNSNNQGKGEFEVIINDTTELIASQYKIKFNSDTDFTITRLSDNKIMATADTSQTVFDIDGFHMEIVQSQFAQGDQYIIDPMANYINHLELQCRSSEQLGLALPIRVTDNFDNAGNGHLTLSNIADITNSSFAIQGQLSPPITIEFTSDTIYQIRNADDNSIIESNLTYDPNSNTPMFPTAGGFSPGYQLSLSGAPKGGDTFLVEFNRDAIGDNRNAILLSQIQAKKCIGNSLSLSEDYQKFANHVSTKANYFLTAQSQSEFLMQEAQANRDMVSGVNVDEELVNLMEFQQFYKASAELVSVANSIFDTIFDVLL